MSIFPIYMKHIIFIHIQFFVLVNGRKIRYSPSDPAVMWENETQDWSDNEENILITYTSNMKGGGNLTITGGTGAISAPPLHFIFDIFQAFQNSLTSFYHKTK